MASEDCKYFATKMQNVVAKPQIYCGHEPLSFTLSSHSCEKQISLLRVHLK